MEPKNTNPAITTEDALKAAYPDLVANIENAVRAEERQRIKAIKDMAPNGYESIVEDAMFENPITAEAVAVKIIAQQKQQGGAYLTNRKEDAENSGVNKVGAAAAVTGAEEEDPFNAAIDKLFPEK